MLYHTIAPADWEQDSVELRSANEGECPHLGRWPDYWDSSFDIRLRSYIGLQSSGAGTRILDIAQYDSRNQLTSGVLRG